MKIYTKTGIFILSDDQIIPKNIIPSREDGPAIEYSEGDKEYWIDGKCHREDGPAIECIDGHKEYWINGKRHRENGHAV